MTISETLNKDIVAIIRQAQAGQLTSGQAVNEIKRIQLMAACARYGPVPDGLNFKQLTKHARRLGLAL